ncbi:MAG: radical SAM/SPASM domain-containing protein [Candidatus Micrarchaeia archaeon]
MNDSGASSRGGLGSVLVSLRSRVRLALKDNWPLYWRLANLKKLVMLPLESLNLLFLHRRTLIYLWKKYGFRRLRKFVLSKLLVREVGTGLLDPLWRTFPSTVPYPINLELEVTTKCNLRCVMCEHTHWTEPQLDLSFEDFKKIIDQFPSLAWCNPTGEGSAFLNPDYPKMLRYLKDRDIMVEFVESFNFLREEQLRELVEIGVDRIWISVDGATKETYEKIRVGGNFERVLGNIKLLMKIKEELNSPIPELCFRFVIMKENYHEMPQFVDVINNLGDKKWLGDGSYVEFAGLLDFDQTQKHKPKQLAVDLVEETKMRGASLGVTVAFAHQYHDPEKKCPVNYCGAWSEPYIMMGGYVQPCCAVLMSNKRDFLREHSFGNVNEKSFKEIWFDPYYKKMRREVPRTKGAIPIQCKGCRAFNTLTRENEYGVFSNK